MGVIDKLKNDWIYATSRYIDDQGFIAHGNRLGKFLSSPLLKKTVLLGGASTLGFAALNEPAMAVGCTIKAIIWPTMLATTIAIKDKLLKRPEFYFDTKPENQMPVNDVKVLWTLQNDRRIESSFMPAAAGLFIGVTATAAMSQGQELLAGATGAAISLLHIYNTFSGRAYRAEKVLSGEWNVVKEKPEPEKRTSAQYAPAL